MQMEQTAKVSVERLRLDHSNPRLVGEDVSASDEEIIARLYGSADIQELLDSIVAKQHIRRLPVRAEPADYDAHPRSRFLRP